MDPALSYPGELQVLHFESGLRSQTFFSFKTFANPRAIRICYSSEFGSSSEIPADAPPANFRFARYLEVALNLAS